MGARGLQTVLFLRCGCSGALIVFTLVLKTGVEDCSGHWLGVLGKPWLLKRKVVLGGNMACYSNSTVLSTPP